MGIKAKLEVKDKGLLALFKRARAIKKSRVKVGVLASGKGGAKHGRSDADVATQGGRGSLTLAQIAAILEFGTEDGHIPARPALRNTFDAMKPELVELGKKLLGAVIDGKMDVKKALNIMGAKLANGVKRTITSGSGVPPANAPSTIAKKGSSRPWVDTGRVVGAISWEVQEGEDANGSDKETSE